MLILDLWGISFYAVVVFDLGKNLLFKSVLGHCVVTQALHFDTFWLKFMIILADLGFESLIHSPENITNKTKIKYSALIAKKLDL